jgi:cellobiose phosphorylase
MTLFIIRHYLGLRFEGDNFVIQPALYPNSPAVVADIRIRDGRLRLEIEGDGAIKNAIVNGTIMPPEADGSIRLNPDMLSGEVTIKTK